MWPSTAHLLLQLGRKAGAVHGNVGVPCSAAPVSIMFHTLHRSARTQLRRGHVRALDKSPTCCGMDSGWVGGISEELKVGDPAWSGFMVRAVCPCPPPFFSSSIHSFTWGPGVVAAAVRGEIGYQQRAKPWKWLGVVRRMLSHFFSNLNDSMIL